MIRQTAEGADEAFREQCRRQMDRPIELRMRYGFVRKLKLLESFRSEYEQRHPSKAPLKSAADVASQTSGQ